ncbi:MAG: hypothetical protein QGH21_06195, partial [Candidatus Poseidoniia archaeon]|nr:hypothetical protein [Candidatus Poseidoniia archaeon]
MRLNRTRLKQLGEIMAEPPSHRTVQRLFSALNYDHAGPEGLDRPDFGEADEYGVSACAYAGHHGDFGIIHLEMEAESPVRRWKAAARRVFAQHLEVMVVCSAPGEERLLLSNHYHARKRGEPVWESRMRHIPLALGAGALTRPVQEWLAAVALDEEERLSTVELVERVNGAFDGYAKQLQDDLRENVYQALRAMAKGLVSVKANKVSATESDLAEAREELFFLLYRLLFVLYAEDRELLPTSDPAYYRDFSLGRLKQELLLPLEQPDAEAGTLLREVARKGLWNRLRNLFDLINNGSVEMKVRELERELPAYNGRLFSTKRAEGEKRRLAKWKFPDDALVKALRYLTRACDRDGNWFFINYATLETRHLGSVYEGLLEYRMRIAEEPMVAVKSGKAQEWKPEREAGRKRYSDRAEAGEIYLETDRGERKATGSYYTPNYIVEYIVEHTVGPLVRQKLAEAHAACDTQELLGPLPESETEESGVSPQDYGALVAAQPDSMKQDGARDAAWNAILSLNVLDPAMGSGHFLVGASAGLVSETLYEDGF